VTVFFEIVAVNQKDVAVSGISAHPPANFAAGWQSGADWARRYIVKVPEFSPFGISLADDLETLLTRKALKYGEYSCGFSQS
jgi:hypothetical protein